MEDVFDEVVGKAKDSFNRSSSFGGPEYPYAVATYTEYQPYSRFNLIVNGALDYRDRYNLGSHKSTLQGNLIFSTPRGPVEELIFENIGYNLCSGRVTVYRPGGFVSGPDLGRAHSYTDILNSIRFAGVSSDSIPESIIHGMTYGSLEYVHELGAV